jgi:glycosyltransferase involved in cell wall biosynthesis
VLAAAPEAEPSRARREGHLDRSFVTGPMRGTEPVRVLQLSKGLGPGGAERLVLSFARLVDPRRISLQAAYLLPWKDHLVAELRGLGVTVTCLDGPLWFDPRWLVRLRRLVRQERIEVVHVHSPMVAALARLALRLPGRHRPIVVGTEHNMWSSYHPLTRWTNALTLPLQRATLAVSAQVKGSMPPRLRSRAEVVIHGADVRGIGARAGERRAARTELGLTDDELVVVTVANLRADKDYPTLLHAARDARRIHPELHFLSVGQGPLADDLTRVRDDLELGDGFRFLGYQQDPIRVLVAADVFCLSSRFEGLSIALVEAMAAALPAVVTAVGGMPSVVRDGVEGRLVAPGSPSALAEALVAMADPALRHRCGAAAKERAAEFAADRAVNRQEDLYEELVGRVGR